MRVHLPRSSHILSCQISPWKWKSDKNQEEYEIQNDEVKEIKVKETLKIHKIKRWIASPRSISFESNDTPVTKLDEKWPWVRGFVRTTQGDKVKHGEYSEIQSAQDFDPKTYKLLVKVGYNPKKNLTLGLLHLELSSKQIERNWAY